MLRKSLFEKVSALAILTAAATMSPNTYAASGDGHGFNGPTLSPISIPVQVDRFPSLDEIWQAVGFCSAGQAPGFKSLQQRIGESLYGKNSGIDFDVFLPGGHSGASYNYCVDQGLCNKAVFPNMRATTNTNTSSENLVFQYEGQFLALAPDLKRLRAGLGEYVGLTADKFLPYVGLSDVVEDSQYDQWGRPVVDAYVRYRTVKIIAPQGYEKPVTFINSSSKRSVGFTVDLTEYVECIQSQIQKIK